MPWVDNLFEGFRNLTALIRDHAPRSPPVSLGGEARGAASLTGMMSRAKIDAVNDVVEFSGHRIEVTHFLVDDLLVSGPPLAFEGFLALPTHNGHNPLWISLRPKDLAEDETGLAPDVVRHIIKDLLRVRFVAVPDVMLDCKRYHTRDFRLSFPNSFHMSRLATRWRGRQPEAETWMLWSTLNSR
jgi:hypothetical protein